MTDMFTLDEVPEIHLERAPLAKVLTQVRFSRTPVIVSDEGEDRISGLLRNYPVRRQGFTGQLGINLGTDGMPAVQSTTMPVRILADASSSWQVTLTETSATLETSAYDSRQDFCERALALFSAIQSVATPPVIDRLGIRYIDRFLGKSIQKIPHYIRPQLRILQGLNGESVDIEYSVSDSLMRIGPQEFIQVKTGALPPMGAFDPSLQPVAENSWMLDIDVFALQPDVIFDSSLLNSTLRRFSGHAHSLFRFATTPDFIKDHERAD